MGFMKYVLCPEIQGKTHQGLKKKKKPRKLSLGNWAGQTAKYSGGLPVLAEMEKEAKTPLSHVQDESLLLLPPLHSYIITFYI